MANPVFGFLLFAGLFWASKQVPYHIPQVLLGMRIAYALSTFLVIIIYSYTKGSIEGSKDTTPLPQTSKDGKEPKTTATVQEYDLQQWKTLVKGFCMSLAMMATMHIYLGMPGPLLINMVVPLKTAVSSELVQIHVFGKEVKRPFPEPESMVTMIGAARTKIGLSKNKKVESKQE